MKTQKRIRLVTAIALVFLVSVFALFFALPPGYDESEIINTAVNVIDGDTFEFYNEEGKIQIIRLLCVDTPEKNQIGYEEAKLFLESLIFNKQVTLQSSVTDKDAYGRLLRYVYVVENEEKLFVNRLILEHDYGQLLIIPPEDCREVR